jgi:hypothetical protein
MNGYLNQQCNNFKDPGVQNFAGNLFNSIRQIADEAFCMIPAPKPTKLLYSCNSYNSYNAYNNYNSNTTTSQNTPTNMTAYYDRGGACFDGEGYVTMYSEETGEYYLPVKSLQKGQTVRTILNNKLFSTKIKCVIKTKVPGGTILMCNISNMFITPWHPILLGEWTFPINVVEEKPVKINYIYNIVLESSHVLFINSCPVVTLGHNFTEPVVAHSYFGSQLVIQDLSQMAGWDDGLIILNNPMVMRSEGLVSKLTSI